MSSFSNDYQILKIHVANGVSTCTIHHKHPACVMTNELSNEIRKFVTEAEGNNDVRVIVFKSADPDFFIAHFDLFIFKGFFRSSSKICSIQALLV